MSEQENQNNAAADDEEPLWHFSYEKASKLRRITSYAAAIMLIVVSIFKLISITDSNMTVRTFIMAFYFITIGTILVMVEYGVGSTQ